MTNLACIVLIVGLNIETRLWLRHPISPKLYKCVALLPYYSEDLGNQLTTRLRSIRPSALRTVSLFDGPVCKCTICQTFQQDRHLLRASIYKFTLKIGKNVKNVTYLLDFLIMEIRLP